MTAIDYIENSEILDLFMRYKRDLFKDENISLTSSVASINDIIQARKTVREVYMDERIEKYILDIVFATRDPKENNLPGLADLISYGGSPRASINLALAAKAYAYLQRRGYVIPEDIRAICKDVLRHRIGLTYEAQAENISAEDIIDKILNTVKVP